MELVFAVYSTQGFEAVGFFGFVRVIAQPWQSFLPEEPLKPIENRA